MTISIGDRIPPATMKIINEQGFGDISTDDLFKGKKVAIFGIPGAFTPTCSAKHLPSYVNNAGALAAKGVDSIVCMAVNDAFVMDAWGKSQNVGDAVMMVGDGNGELTRALGLEMDAAGFGMGERCQRFSMVVDDGVVTALNVEAPGEYSISSAESMLDQL